MVDRSRVPIHRLALVVVAALAAGLIAWSAGLHRLIVQAVEASAPIFANHPVSGALLFIGLAAVSAAVVFFSNVVLVPFGVHVWGEAGCFLLLWIGWFLGGVVTYTIGRQFGRPIVRWVLPPDRMAEYEARIPPSPTFLPVLLAQLALPSEAAGYLFGLIRVPARTYLVALAVAEVPYAVGTVLLGAAFFHREYGLLLSLALAGLLLLSWLAWRQRRSHHPPPSPT